ncbi:hypothetical protein CHS0354_007912 [Potamilus streckersoni]|uniref:Uncharacterized protein n=1 Tax=Potamilus streckersoni TaxID=2493646 RepID=A0AAE0S9R6_9BIVA|nr:hypothetical protein CHS0354_007912 [Potamilus streckersoni]
MHLQYEKYIGREILFNPFRTTVSPRRCLEARTLKITFQEDISYCNANAAHADADKSCHQEQQEQRFSERSHSISGATTVPAV